MKKCSRCSIVKEDIEFSKDKYRPTGLNGWCKQCGREHYNANKHNYRMTQRKYRMEHPELSKNRKSKYLLDWINYFSKKYPNSFYCGICGKELILSLTKHNKRKDVVHFDHRNGRNGIDSPSDWLRSHPCNQENIKLWEGFNFGILCVSDNVSLPTNNRKEWLEAALRYTNGV